MNISNKKLKKLALKFNEEKFNLNDSRNLIQKFFPKQNKTAWIQIAAQLIETISSNPLLCQSETAFFNVSDIIKSQLGELVTNSFETPPKYNDHLWSNLNRLWEAMQSGIEKESFQFNIRKFTSWLLTSLINLNIITRNSTPASAFDIVERLSFVHQYFKNMHLDIILHCETFTNIKYRKPEVWFPIVERIFIYFTVQNLKKDMFTFFKLLLLAKLVFIMSTGKEEGKALFRKLRNLLKIPPNFSTWAEQTMNWVPPQDATLKFIIKHIHTPTFYDILYHKKDLKKSAQGDNAVKRTNSVKPVTCNKIQKSLKVYKKITLNKSVTGPKNNITEASTSSGKKRTFQAEESDSGILCKKKKVVGMEKHKKGLNHPVENMKQLKQEISELPGSSNLKTDWVNSPIRSDRKQKEKDWIISPISRAKTKELETLLSTDKTWSVEKIRTTLDTKRNLEERKEKTKLGTDKMVVNQNLKSKFILDEAKESRQLTMEALEIGKRAESAPGEVCDSELDIGQSNKKKKLKSQRKKSGLPNKKAKIELQHPAEVELDGPTIKESPSLEKASTSSRCAAVQTDFKLSMENSMQMENLSMEKKTKDSATCSEEPSKPICDETGEVPMRKVETKSEDKSEGKGGVAATAQVDIEKETFIETEIMSQTSNSDIEILEGINELIEFDFDSEESSDTSVDEASGSDRDIEPCDEENKMFTAEETKAYHQYLVTEVQESQKKKVQQIFKQELDICLKNNNLSITKSKPTEEKELQTEHVKESENLHNLVPDENSVCAQEKSEANLDGSYGNDDITDLETVYETINRDTKREGSVSLVTDRNVDEDLTMELFSGSDEEIKELKNEKTEIIEIEHKQISKNNSLSKSKADDDDDNDLIYVKNEERSPRFRRNKQKRESTFIQESGYEKTSDLSSDKFIASSRSINENEIVDLSPRKSTNKSVNLSPEITFDDCSSLPLFVNLDPEVEVVEDRDFVLLIDESPENFSSDSVFEKSVENDDKQDDKNQHPKHIKKLTFGNKKSGPEEEKMATGDWEAKPVASSSNPSESVPKHKLNASPHRKVDLECENDVPKNSRCKIECKSAQFLPGSGKPKLVKGEHNEKELNTQECTTSSGTKSISKQITESECEESVSRNGENKDQSCEIVLGSDEENVSNSKITKTEINGEGSSKLLVENNKLNVSSNESIVRQSTELECKENAPKNSENKENIVNNNQGHEIELVNVIGETSSSGAVTRGTRTGLKIDLKSPLKRDLVTYMSPKKVGSARRSFSLESGSPKIQEITTLTPLKVVSAALQNEITISPDFSDEENASQTHCAQIMDNEDVLEFVPSEDILSKSCIEEEQLADVSDKSSEDNSSGTRTTSSIKLVLRSSDNLSSPSPVKTPKTDQSIRKNTIFSPPSNSDSNIKYGLDSPVLGQKEIALPRKSPRITEENIAKTEEEQLTDVSDESIEVNSSETKTTSSMKQVVLRNKDDLGSPSPVKTPNADKSVRKNTIFSSPSNSDSDIKYGFESPVLGQKEIAVPRKSPRIAEKNLAKTEEEQLADVSDESIEINSSENKATSSMKKVLQGKDDFGNDLASHSPVKTLNADRSVRKNTIFSSPSNSDVIIKNGLESPSSVQNEITIPIKSPRLPEKNLAETDIVEDIKMGESEDKITDPENLESEERDQLSSPKRTRRRSMMMRRLGIETSPNEAFIRSPRTRRSSMSSIKNDDDLAEEMMPGSPARTPSVTSDAALASPLRLRRRRNSALGTLTPSRRSRRISGLVEEPLKE